MLEFSATLPLLVTVLFMTFDLGLCVQQYFRVSRVAYEGARFAATIAGLEEGHFKTGQDENLNPIPKQQAKLRDRITTLLSYYQLPGEAGGSVIVTEYGLNGKPSESEQVDHTVERLIFVKVEVPYQAISPIFPDITVTVTASGPYLYRPRV